MDDDAKIIDQQELVMVEVLKQFTTLEQIEALEGELLAVSPCQVHVKHSFSRGIYARQVSLPAGYLAIGHAHTEECLNIVVAGRVSVVIDGEVREISAPATFVSAPYQRKIGYVHEPLIWITIHPVSGSFPLEKLEDALIAKSDTFKAYEATHGEKSTSIASCPRDDFWDDRVDYFSCIKELGFTHAEVRKITEDTKDQTDQGLSDAVYVGTSPIQGNGVFCAVDFKEGETLSYGRIGGKRTKAGRYTNHSKLPNCKFVVDGKGNMVLVAVQDIRKGEEATVDYRQAFLAARAADNQLKN